MSRIFLHFYEFCCFYPPTPTAIRGLLCKLKEFAVFCGSRTQYEGRAGATVMGGDRSIRVSPGPIAVNGKMCYAIGRKGAVFVFWSRFDPAVKAVFGGHLLLILCCVLYLLWWSIAFRPDSLPGSRVSALTVALLVLTAAAGVAGTVVALRGVLALPQSVRVVPGSLIAWGGVAVYVVLLALTSVLLHRQVTTELLLIVGWTVLELVTLNALRGAERLSPAPAVGLFVLALAACAAAMVCYLLYYRLDAGTGYVVGMVPLTAAAVSMFILCAALARGVN